MTGKSVDTVKLDGEMRQALAAAVTWCDGVAARVGAVAETAAAVEDGLRRVASERANARAEARDRRLTRADALYDLREEVGDLVRDLRAEMAPAVYLVQETEKGPLVERIG